MLLGGNKPLKAIKQKTFALAPAGIKLNVNSVVLPTAPYTFRYDRCRGSILAMMANVGAESWSSRKKHIKGTVSSHETTTKECCSVMARLLMSTPF